MSRAIQTTAFPSAMEMKLRRILWRQVIVAVVRAVAITMSVLITAMLIAMLADWWFTLFHTGVRTAITATSLAVATASFAMVGIRPVMRAFGWMRAAQITDAEVPQLEERWTTISQFASSGQRPSTPVTKAMLAQVASEAVALSGLVQPSRVVRLGRLKQVLLVAAGCTALLFGVLAWHWDQNSVLLRRFWAPTTPITATQLESVTGDALIPRGQSIEIITRLSGLQRNAATLSLNHDSGQVDTIQIAPEDDSPETFAHRFEVDQSFHYRVRSGDGQTQWHRITAIDPPEISDVRLKITAPEYVDRPPYEKSTIPGRVKVIQGSRLDLAMRSDQELASFELLVTTQNGASDATDQKLVLTPDTDGWYRYQALLEQDLTFSPTLLGPYGLRDRDERSCRIRVVADKAPVARVISPNEEMSVSPNETIPIKFEAHDDFGIAKAELVVYREDETGEQQVLSVREIPIDEQGSPRHALGETALDLSEFNLESGAQISYAIRVTDNRMMKLNQREARSLGENRSEPSQRNDPSQRVNEISHDGPNDFEAIAQSMPASSSPESGKASPREADDEISPIDNRSIAESGTQPVESSEDQPQTNLPQVNEQSTSTTTGSQSNPDQTAGVPNGQHDAVSSDPEGGDESTITEAAASPTTNDEIPDGEKVDRSAIADSSTDPSVESTASVADPQRQPQMDKGSQSLAQNGSGTSSQSKQESSDADRDDALAATLPELPPREPSPSSGSVETSETRNGNSTTNAPPLEVDRDLKFVTQLGQNTESNRMLVRISDRLAVVAEAGQGRHTDAMNTRELLSAIDEQLEVAETRLSELNEQPEVGAVSTGAQQVDLRLKRAELIIADLRSDSKETKYEFVGLQMLDISRTHLTPALDRMFVLIQNPGSNPNRNILEALHHTSSAREFLATLTEHFEEVARERELAESLEEVAEFYEVYVENMQSVLRAAQRNRNPMQRKMAIVEVDEDYLQRYADVLEMRREVMAEFGRILSDDPRLMGKYMDLLKRRRNNLRRRLTELHERQDEVGYDLAGWMRIDQDRRPDVWIQLAEMRLLAVKDLVTSATQLERRSLSQLPLDLDPGAASSGQVVQLAKEVALTARKSSVTSRQLRDAGLADEKTKAALMELADELTCQLQEFDAALEYLSFQHDGSAEVRTFVNRRLSESRELGEQAVAWAEVAFHVRHGRFHGLAAIDQQRLAIDTDRLRIEMVDIEDGLGGLFVPDGVPGEVVEIIDELLATVEAVTFNQAAAAYELNRNQLAKAEAQQSMATEGFVRAEALFDKMRRTVVDILDEQEVNDPDIADLEDPTIDEFLERLEREPNLNQLLGLPNRPTNLRVVRDWMLWETEGGGANGASAQQAAANANQRAEELSRGRLMQVPKKTRSGGDREITEEELERFASAEEMEEELEAMRRTIEEKLKDPELSDQRRRELQKKSEMLAQMLEEARAGSLRREKWAELANADATKAMMEALASGQPIPDRQWNRLISTLDTGLWQVRGRTPPEDYRKPIEQYQDLIRRVLNAESADEF